MNNLNKINWLKEYLKTKVIYSNKFNHIGSKTVIFEPMQFSETKSISIGDCAFIAHHVWLMGNDKSTGVTLDIGSFVQIGHFAHIIAKHKVVIEDSVLMADKVYISDCGHNYEDIDIPILTQGIHVVGEVRIGEGSWIGENVCIIGAKVGKHCVIGANAVVTKDIPDYSVAVGIPAKVIKRYNNNSNEWLQRK